MEFHWWYVLIALVLLFLFTGKSRGGIVVKKFSADLEILDDRFADCTPTADYFIFKQGKPEHIDIELDDLTIPVGDEVEFFINKQLLATVKVKRDHEAEFDHWADDDVHFPKIKEGDNVLIRYQNADALKGTFHLNG